VVSISKITRKFANHENVSAIFLEPTIFIFLSIILEIDLDTSKPWCLVYKRRPLSIICLGFGRRTTCVNKQPPATQLLPVSEQLAGMRQHPAGQSAKIGTVAEHPSLH
jgi:hypothetical protein